MLGILVSCSKNGTTQSTHQSIRNQKENPMVKPIRRKSYNPQPQSTTFSMNSIEELSSKIETLTKVIEETAQREQMLDELIALKQKSEEIQSRYQEKLALFSS